MHSKVYRGLVSANHYKYQLSLINRAPELCCRQSLTVTVINYRP